MPNRYDSIDQFFSANQKSLTPEEQKTAQQHSTDPNNAVSQELDYIVGNDASVGVIADTPSAFGKLGIDYRNIFGQTTQEGLSTLTILLLMVFIFIMRDNWLNVYSPKIEQQLAQTTLTKTDSKGEINLITGQGSLSTWTKLFNNIKFTELNKQVFTDGPQSQYRCQK